MCVSALVKGCGKVLAGEVCLQLLLEWCMVSVVRLEVALTLMLWTSSSVRVCSAGFVFV